MNEVTSQCTNDTHSDATTCCLVESSYRYRLPPGSVFGGNVLLPNSAAQNRR